MEAGLLLNTIFVQNFSINQPYRYLHYSMFQLNTEAVGNAPSLADGAAKTIWVRFEILTEDDDSSHLRV
jgi:hypothetical protein